MGTGVILLLTSLRTFDYSRNPEIQKLRLIGYECCLGDCFHLSDRLLRGLVIAPVLSGLQMPATRVLIYLLTHLLIHLFTAVRSLLVGRVIALKPNACPSVTVFYGGQQKQPLLSGQFI